MTKYRVEFQSSKEILEQEAQTIKRLYDIVRSDFRFSMNHVECDGFYIPYEEALFYKWDEHLDMWVFIGAMFLNITPYHKDINLTFSGLFITIKEVLLI